MDGVITTARWKQRLVLLGAIALVFYPVFTFSFVNIDDGIHTYRNPHLNPPSLKGVGELWKEPYRKLYIPLTYSVWAIVSAFATKRTPVTPPVMSLEGGENLYASPFHGVNFVLHLLVSCFVVFPLLRALVRNDKAALLGALLFGIHPVQVEPVAWVSGLKDVLCGGLSLVSMLLFVKRRSAWAFFFFGLALLAKPSAVALPVALMGIALIFLERPWRKVVAELAPWLLLSLPIMGITAKAQINEDFDMMIPPLWQRPLVALDAVFFYFKQLIFPWHLSIDYGREPGVVLKWPALYWIGLLLLSGWGIRWLFRARATKEGAALWFFVASLIPVLGGRPFVFQLISTVADRYCYLAMAGAGLFLALLYLRLEQKKWATSLTYLLLVFFAIRSAAQVQVWKDSKVLFAHAIRLNPRSWLSHNNLGVMYEGEKNWPKAAMHYEASAAIRENPTVYNNLGAVYLAQKRNWQARQAFLKALTLSPDDAMLYNNIGAAWMAAGDLQKAKESFLQAQRIDPQLTQIRDNLRKVEELSGRG